MHLFKNVILFKDKYPLLGPTIWMLSIHYFIIQIVVAVAWQLPFSLSQNTISDLGNTQCAVYSGRAVCSPAHALMNASFVLLGLIMAIGSLLIYQEFKKTRATMSGFTMLGIAGLGTILVGIFPENTIAILHFLGAGAAFLIGNIGIVILGIALRLPKWLFRYTLLSGILSLTALALFLTNHFLGFGPGGMERIIAYPQTIWLIIFGIYISYNHTAKSQ